MPDLQQSVHTPGAACQVVVIWIDWYAYHLARFEGLQSAFGYNGEVRGIEWVGGVGVHAGLKFREERPASLPVETLLPESSWQSANKFSLAWKTWRRLNHLDPQVVLTPGYYTLPAVVTALWSKWHRRASVLMTESTRFDHPRTSWTEWLKARVIRALFDWAVVGGSAHRDYLAELKFPVDRIVDFYDVVGNEEIHAQTTSIRVMRSAHDYGLPVNYFLFVGRLAAEKNIVGLLKAWLAYREQGGTWPLVIAGDGPEAGALLHVLSASTFADQALLLGHKNSIELAPIYAFAGCFVLASTREPWGLVVNEAMAAGLPVIVSSRCGSAADLVQRGDNGYIFDPADAASLKSCLNAIAQLSAEKRKAMGLRSVERIEPYSPQSFGREIAFIASHSPRPSDARLHSQSEGIA